MPSPGRPKGKNTTHLVTSIPIALGTLLRQVSGNTGTPISRIVTEALTSHFKAKNYSLAVTF